VRVLLTGAGGLIGAAVLARLRAAGHPVVAVVRSGTVPADRVVRLDIARATRPEDWQPHLQGVDAVVNCAGVLQDGPGSATRGVHLEGVAALYAACVRAKVRRVVHVSAIGVDRAQPSGFSQTKRAGEQALQALDLDWVILRPSIVLGRAAFGGSAFFRGLAVLPVLPVPPGTGPLQTVQLDDLVRTVLFFLAPAAPARIAIDVTDAEQHSFAGIVAAYRRWLGWPPALGLPVPGWLAGLPYRLGDGAGVLGWRPPLRSTARLELARGAAGDGTAWRRLTGIVPTGLEAALAAEPASVQERWFARLYLLKPLGLIVFAAFCIATGLIAIGPGRDGGAALLLSAGFGPGVAEAGVVAGALADIAIGLAMLVRRRARPALWAALGLSLLYLAAGSVLLPGLWGDPLGPLLKLLPILVLNLMLLAILPER